MLVPHRDDEDHADPDYTPHTKAPREQQVDIVKRNIKKWEKVYQAVRRRIKNAQEERAQNQAEKDHPFHPYQPDYRVRKRNHATVPYKVLRNCLNQLNLRLTGYFDGSWVTLIMRSYSTSGQ